MPGMSGSRGRFSEPTALMTNRASSSSSAAVGVAEPDEPRAVASSHVSAGHRGAEAAVRAEVVLVEDLGEVVPQLGLPAVVLAPVVRRLERVAVLVAADVDPGAGVAVLPPGAAGAVVLVDDGERQAGLGEADAGEDAGLAAADHDDRGGGLHVVGDLVAPRDGPACRRRRTACPRRASARGGPASGSPARNDIISTRSSWDRALRLAARRPGRRRWPGARGAGISARSSSVSPHWKSVEVAGCGSVRSRIHDGSPVMCTSEHSSAGHAHVLEHRGDRGVVVGERHAGVRVAGRHGVGGRGRGAVGLEHELVGVAPPPVLARLVGADERVVGVRVEVGGGVPVRGAVAAADVAARPGTSAGAPNARRCAGSPRSPRSTARRRRRCRGGCSSPGP